MFSSTFSSKKSLPIDDSSTGIIGRTQLLLPPAIHGKVSMKLRKRTEQLNFTKNQQRIIKETGTLYNQTADTGLSSSNQPIIGSIESKPLSIEQEPRKGSRATHTTTTFSIDDLQQYSVENDLITHEDHSLTFILFRYPFLVVCTLALIIDLIFYWTFRGIVSSWEIIHHKLTSTRRLKDELVNSLTYEEYKAVAQTLDHQLGHDDWKLKETRLFDERLVKRITEELKRDRVHFRTRQLIDTLLTSAIKSDLGGIENEELYSRCYYGTKYSIDEYVQEVVDSLNCVGNAIDIDQEAKYTFFKQASRLYGRTALCLSGGGGLAWFHMGVCKSLFEQKLLPKVFTGASAGSMVAAMICVRTDDELDELFQLGLWKRIKCCSATTRVIFINVGKVE